ncbi:FKBP-type peptidyl-prolyl cis-trans isomerase [uncultured Amnibacterium sp.]|uniref:FKBP-type peptidyl-prolyl cis-trans isomerase n=1 Tax=uncultured Amnibacterium sp. TaxID=1631851 RepID=UPI0035CC336C
MHRTARLLAGSAAAALVVAALTGCAGGSASVGGCTPKASPGAASEGVTATGAFGTEPTVGFRTPAQVNAVEASQLIAGSGAPITSKQEIVADVTFLDATTGDVVLKTDYTAAAAARFVVGTVAVTGLRKALVCARVGERLAVVMPAGQGIPAASRPASLSATDSVVAIVDVRKAYLARANGTDQVMAGGLPSVVLGPDGRPGITLPEDAPPTTLQVANLKKGSGAVVRDGQTAVVQYTGVVWKPGDAANGQVFDSSWTTGAPVDLPVKKGQIIPGLVTALAGQRVGSQVIAVIPAKQAYGSQSTSTIPANATLVFVVDVLGRV